VDAHGVPGIAAVGAMVTQKSGHDLNTRGRGTDTAQRLLETFANPPFLGVRHVIDVADTEDVRTGLKLDDLELLATGAMADEGVIGTQHKEIERVVVTRLDGFHGPTLISRVGAEKRHWELPSGPTARIAPDLVL
jgi:hypothetical protein